MALEWIWYFIWYSFLGFLLEVGYARWTGGRRDRKCLLLLPLCPVYGLGACAVLLLPPWVLERPLLLVVAGGAAATGVEYGMALFYERVLRVSFWNYDGLTGSIHGRVCLPFALAWSLLILPLVYLVHPAVARLADGIPAPVSWAVLAALIKIKKQNIKLAQFLLLIKGRRPICGKTVDNKGKDCLRWTKGLIFCF